MKRLRVLIAMSILAVSQTNGAQGNMMRPAAGPVPVLNRFVKVDAIDFKVVLPAPPRFAPRSQLPEV